MSGSPGLRRFVGAASVAGPPASPARPDQAAPPGRRETCEFCAAEVPPDHGHVADLDAATLMCACRACYLLFTHPGSGAAPEAPGGAAPEAPGVAPEAPGGMPQSVPSPARQPGRGRYRAIPDRYRSDPARPLSIAEWDALDIPVGLAFFLRSSRDGRTTAFYPSPAGATECRLDLAAWQLVCARYPLLAAAVPDVEAILISRDGRGVEAFLVPIDTCYELAGRMRLQWRGFDGGAEARQSIAEFLDGVRARSRDLSQEP